MLRRLLLRIEHLIVLVHQVLMKIDDTSERVDKLAESSEDITLYTMPMACEHFHVDPTTARRWIRNGELEHTQIGGSIYFTRQQLRACPIPVEQRILKPSRSRNAGFKS